MNRDHKTQLYFQTTRMSHDELTEAIWKAKSQEMRIAAWFVKRMQDIIGKCNRFSRTWEADMFVRSPSDVWETVFYKLIPITSVRRAMTQLTRRGFLTKTDVLVDGLYGKPEHTWKLSDAAIRAMRPDYKQLELSDLLPA